MKLMIIDVLLCYCRQRVRLLEEKVAVLTEELNAARHLEPVINSDALEQMERRLQRAENELVAGEVLRDNLRTDKEKVYFLSTIFQ